MLCRKDKVIESRGMGKGRDYFGNEKSDWRKGGVKGGQR